MLIVGLEDMGIAQDNHLVMWFFLIGQIIEILCFLILHLVELLLRHLEKPLEGQFVDIGALLVAGLSFFIIPLHCWYN